MKQANFDVSHELDEFLMVEKPLTHTKRKANTDLGKLKPELRQLEEQYVPAGFSLAPTNFSLASRFTVYDFDSTKRMSYYPHNQPIVTIAESDTDRTLAQSQTGTISLIPTATIAERSQAGSPTFDSTHQHPLPKPHLTSSPIIS